MSEFNFDYNSHFRSWSSFIENNLNIKRELQKTVVKLRESTNTYFPKSSQIFRAFREVSIDDVQYVLIGMDPYNNIYKNKPSACGLAFVTENGYINPSLRVLSENLNIHPNEFKDFMLRKKVLLLNYSLTVECNKAGSHKSYWKDFSKVLIASISRYKPNLTWILLGNDAKELSEFIVDGKIMKDVHPSYLHRNGISKYQSYQRMFKELNWI